MHGLRWSSTKRSRWAAIGAAVAVTIGSGGLMSASADVSSGDKPVFVSITPCRVVDTRPGSDNVGARATPLNAAETYAFMVRGTNGNCTIPTDAVGVAVNVAAVFPTASSFFTLFPADAATRPLSANLNFVAGQPPVSNSASIRLSADGRMSIFNLAGTVHFTLDVTGYYVNHNHNDLYYTKAEIDPKLTNFTSAQILDGTIATLDLADNAVTTPKIADNAVTGAKIPDYTAAGGLSNEDIGVLFAAVEFDGDMVRNSGAALTDVTSTRVGVGSYRVDFNRNISGCVYVADVETGPATTDTNLFAGTTDTISVHTHNTGVAGSPLTDYSFQVVVVC